MLLFCKKERVYQLARKILAYRIIWLSNILTPQCSNALLADLFPFF
jgi:hypothetical protein